MSGMLSRTSVALWRESKRKLIFCRSPRRWNANSTSNKTVVNQQDTSTLNSNALQNSLKLDKNLEKDALDFLAERGRAIGYQLSLSERRLILKEAGTDGRLSKKEWEKLVSSRYLVEQERRTFSHYLAVSHEGMSQRLLKNTARLGVAFFALTSSHTAGESGMHAFGSILVGCIASLGGGTLNGVMIGAVPVGWIMEPSTLVVAVSASLIGFYAWPLMEDFISEEKKEQKDSNYDDNISAYRYAMESVGLSALAIVGSQQGIIRGLHPLISTTLGATIAFGGVLRDLMCNRDLTLGAATGCQSYGIASLSGAAVYVALREIHVWNCSGSTHKLVHGGLPLGLRILLGFGTVFAIRAIAWQYKPDGILSTMEETTAANKKFIQGLFR